MRKQKNFPHRFLLIPSQISHKQAIKLVHKAEQVNEPISKLGPERILTMKHKLGALLLAIMMLVSLSACSGSAAVSSDSQTDPVQTDTTTGVGSRFIKLTLEGEEGTKEITAVLMDTPAADEFAEHMPFTVKMHEHLDRQKMVYLDFSLSAGNQANTVCEYEIGDIAYWHPGPTLGIFYSHDGCSISAGVEILAKLDAEGVKAIASYADLVSVTFELERPICE